MDDQEQAIAQDVKAQQAVELASKIDLHLMLSHSPGFHLSSDELQMAAAALRFTALSDPRTPASSNTARLCASETACYKWPEDTAEHRALRSAFMDGAASVAGAALPAERSRPGVEALADWFYDNGHEFIQSDEEDVARALLDAFDMRLK